MIRKTGATMTRSARKLIRHEQIAVLGIGRQQVAANYWRTGAEEIAVAWRFAEPAYAFR
jgi:hypothetical protein